MSYVPLTFDAGDDPDSIYALFVAQMQAAFPGWQPYPGHIETVLARAVAGELADLRTLAADVGAAVFAQWGRTTLGLAQVAALPATMPVTFTGMSSTLAQIIPAGTSVGWAGATGDDDVTFALTADVTLPATTTTVAATVTATTAGAAANQVPAGPLVLLDNIGWITGVTATAGASGGLDGETDAAYVARLSLEAQTLAQVPILPGDFAILATQIVGVARALAVDGWNGSSGHGLERTIAVVPLQADGTPVSAGARSAVVALLDERREVTFAVDGALPTYTAIAVATTVAGSAGADPVVVGAAITTAVTAFLSPATWTGATVRLFDLVRVIGDVDGVDHITALTINGTGADHALSGDAPLPAGMAVSAVTDSWLTAVSSVVVTVT